MRRLLYILLILLLVTTTAMAGEISMANVLDTNVVSNTEAQSKVKLTGTALLDGSTPLADQLIILQNKEDDIWFDFLAANTDSQGNFAFEVVAGELYRIKVENNENYIPVKFAEASLGLIDGNNYKYSPGFAIRNDNQSILNYQTSAKLEVAAFLDDNNNGNKGRYELLLPNVLVEVVDNYDVVIKSAYTSEQNIVVEGIEPGNYRLRFTAPQSYWFSNQGKKFDVNNNSITSTENNVGYTDYFDFESNNTVSLAAGLQTASSIGGKVWLDGNNNGIMEKEEAGFANANITLKSQKGKAEYTFTTDDTGIWNFENIKDGTYNLKVEIPETNLFAIYTIEGDRDMRSVFTPYTGHKENRNFMLTAGEQRKNVNIGVVKPGVLVGKAFLDVNYNGVFDEGEEGVENVIVEVIRDSTDASFGKIKTDENGNFTFQALRQNNYRVRAIVPDDGSEFTVVGSGDISNSNKFVQRGNRREFSVPNVRIENNVETSVVIGVAKKVNIGGKVFIDKNFDGLLDKNEKAVNNVKVFAFDENGTMLYETKTNNKGEYRIDGLYKGKVIIKIEPLADHMFVRRLAIEDDSTNPISHIEDGYGVTFPVDVIMNNDNTSINAGMILSGIIKGRLFEDLNDNGLMDSDEPGFEAINVELLDADGNTILTTQSNNNGEYEFDGVMPNDYKIKYTIFDNMEFAELVDGGNTFKAPGLEYISDTFIFNVGDKFEAPLGGIVKLANYKGVFYHDVNGNGVMDDGEKYLTDVSISLTSSNAKQEDKKITTNSNGEFSFENLRPGKLTVTSKLPKDYIFSNGTNKDLLVWSRLNEQSNDVDQTKLIGSDNALIGATIPGKIKVHTWLDENLSGKHDEGEKNFEGSHISIIEDLNGNSVAEAISDTNGLVAIDNLRPGKYTIILNLPEGAKTAPVGESTFVEGADKLGNNVLLMKDVIVTENSEFSNASAGVVTYMKISGKVWLDNEGNKEVKSGTNLDLYSANSNTLVKSTTTDENGIYVFDELLPGEYYIEINGFDGELFVAKDDKMYEEIPHIIESTNPSGRGKSRNITVKMPESVSDKDIVYVLPAYVGDYAWVDLNLNGLPDEGEPAIANLKLSLEVDNNEVYTTTSDGNGYYRFIDVYPGTYTLKVELSEGFTITEPNTQYPFLSSILNESDDTFGYYNNLNVMSGERYYNADIGLALKSGYSLPNNINNPDSQDWSNQVNKTNRAWDK